MARGYEVELWSRQGVMIADISPLVQNLVWERQRNDAPQVSFTIDVDAYEELAAAIGSHPLSMLGPYQTDVKLKRYNSLTDEFEYLFGAHVGYVCTNITDEENSIEVKAFGYLNLLIDRYVTKTYEDQEVVSIAWDLIDETQSQENGDMGITLGPDQVTGESVTRPYERQNVKEAVVGLSLTYGFDVDIDHLRRFNTYTMIGSDRSADVEFLYPGNIKEISIPRDGIPLFNKIYGLGSGFGGAAFTSEQRDETSELNYGVHEKVATFNSVTNQGELDDRTGAELSRLKNLLEIPQMTVSGEDFDLSRYGLGDRVTVRVDTHPFLATVNGTYRIERLEVTVDENGAEDIKIYFDNFGL